MVAWGFAPLKIEASKKHQFNTVCYESFDLSHPWFENSQWCIKRTLGGGRCATSIQSSHPVAIAQH
jgi:hypothetical protein